MTQPPSSVLILGANGLFGHHAALTFARDGWRVKAQVRSGKHLNAELNQQLNIEALTVDLNDDHRLKEAAEDCSIIINGLNPPYRLWQDEIPKIT